MSLRARVKSIARLTGQSNLNRMQFCFGPSLSFTFSPTSPVLLCFAFETGSEYSLGWLQTAVAPACTTTPASFPEKLQTSLWVKSPNLQNKTRGQNIMNIGQTTNVQSKSLGHRLVVWDPCVRWVEKNVSSSRAKQVTEWRERLCRAEQGLREKWMQYWVKQIQ